MNINQSSWDITSVYKCWQDCWQIPDVLWLKEKFTVETCGNLYLANGQVHYSESSLTAGQYPVGTVATWTCNYGFYSLYSYYGSTTCDSSGTWSHRTSGLRNPYCAQCNENTKYYSHFKIEHFLENCISNVLGVHVCDFSKILIVDDCTSLFFLENGQISYNDSVTLSHSYPLHTMATFTCDHGFSLSGATESICLISEHWSNQLPTCNRSNDNIWQWFY